MHFADRLAAAIAATGSPVCVGIDPVVGSMDAALRARHHDPVEAVREFSLGVLRAVAGAVPAVKFQSACFERYGSRGFAALEEAALEAGKLGLTVIWDAKRGDIATTGAHYAAAAVKLQAHSITANAYMGRSALTPLLEAGLGVFALVRTSNPDSDAIQNLRLDDGRTVAEMLADHVRDLGETSLGLEAGQGLSNLGAVVGATKSADAAALRSRMPQTIFLIPGYGAQGGTAEDIRAMIRPGATTPALSGVLVTASRSVIYAAAQPGDAWNQAVARAARQFAAEVGDVVRSGLAR